MVEPGHPPAILTGRCAMVKQQRQQKVRRRKPAARPAGVGLPLIRPDTAGIDIGSMEIFVAVSPDRDPEYVRSFGTFTVDLHRLIQWLRDCGVGSVAMESTGV